MFTVTATVMSDSTMLPSRALFSAEDADRGSSSCQTLPVLIQSQCKPSTTLPASPVAADQWPTPGLLEHALCHQELPPSQQTRMT